MAERRYLEVEFFADDGTPLDLSVPERDLVARLLRERVLIVDGIREAVAALEATLAHVHPAARKSARVTLGVLARLADEMHDVTCVACERLTSRTEAQIATCADGEHRWLCRACANEGDGTPERGP